MIKKTEGITLKSTIFKENSRIIQIFSQDLGNISVFLKKISAKKPYLLALSSPFCHGEFLLKKNKGEIFSFLDGSIINSHLCLRKNLPTLQAASFCLRSILKTQLQEKNSLLPFKLLQSYLKAFPFFQDPFVLLSSFYLKLLLHEGLLYLSPKCNTCNGKTIAIHLGECLCSSHAPPYGFYFSHEQISTMILLATAKKFSSLLKVKLDRDLKEKISFLFEDLI